MPPRYAFRLEDLRVFHQVRASCRACGHKAIVTNATLLQGRAGYTRRCGANGAGRGARPRWMSNSGRAIEFRNMGRRAPEFDRGGSRSLDSGRRAGPRLPDKSVLRMMAKIEAVVI
jgi:hypothetical protein